MSVSKLGRIKEGYLHRHGIKKLRDFAKANGYEICPVPQVDADLILRKDDRLYVIEVKSIGYGAH